MTLGGGGGQTRDRPVSFVKEHVTHQMQFVILCFPAGGKFAITAHVEILVLFLQKLHCWSVVEMGDKKLEEFLRRNDLTDLGEIFKGICIIDTVYEKMIIFENR